MPRQAMEQIAPEKQLYSDFNEAKLQIFRLHQLWSDCNQLSQTGQLTRWKWKLDSAWRELSTDARQRDGYNSYTEWIKEGIKDKGSYLSINSQINQLIAESQGEPTALYNALQQKEVFLRCLQEDVGKGAKRSSDEDDDLED